MVVAIALLAGIIVGWLIEWVIDWQYWRRGIAGFYADEAQLRSEMAATEEELHQTAQALEAVQQELQATRAQLQAARVREAELQRRVNDSQAHLDDVQSPDPSAATAISQSDDLTRIEGVTTQQMARMREAGVNTFAQLAQTPIEQLQEIVQPASWQHIDYAKWQQQAAQLATQPESERS